MVDSKTGAPSQLAAWSLDLWGHADQVDDIYVYTDEYAGLAAADAGQDRLDGGAGADRLDGGKQDDSVQSRDGDDIVIADFGDDTIDGGAGSDTLGVDALLTGFRLEGTSAQGRSIDLDQSGTGLGADSFTSIELVRFIDRTLDLSSPASVASA